MADKKDGGKLTVFELAEKIEKEFGVKVSVASTHRKPLVLMLKKLRAEKAQKSKLVPGELKEKAVPKTEKKGGK